MKIKYNFGAFPPPRNPLPSKRAFLKTFFFSLSDLMGPGYTGF